MKTQIMTTAHAVAKQLNEKVGNYSIALSMALKEVWKRFKILPTLKYNFQLVLSVVDTLTKVKTQAGFIFGVPTWIIEKNLSNEEAFSVLNYTYGAEVIRETEKAELVKFDTKFGYIQMWCPKSVMAA